jgi:predicted metal-dependent hydrolase
VARRRRPPDPAQIGLLEAARADSRGIEVRESRRARRLGLKVHPWGRVEVIVPHGTPAARVRRFVHENQAWIERTRRVMGIDAALPAEAVPNNIVFPLTGESFGVAWDREAAGAPADLRRCAGRIGLRGSETEVLESLRRWLLKHARRALAPKLAALSDQTGLSYRRLQVRRQRTRWGSCSSSGTISLNGCLLFLTPAQARYLMIHELCHTRHMNHSAAFWSLVERFQPGARVLDREVSEAWRSIPAWVMSG